MLFPIETLCLQTAFHGLFVYAHNSGTWFVSCIVMCYVVFPYALFIIRNISKKNLWIMLSLLVFILLYSPYVQLKLSLPSLYDNPIFRIMEFLIGIILFFIWERYRMVKFVQILFTRFAIAFELLFLIIGITLLRKVGLPHDFMLHSIIALPTFCFLIFSLTGTKEILQHNKYLPYMSNLTLPFFLAQLFFVPLSTRVLLIISCNSNGIKIAVSFIICLLISIMLHELVQKRLKNYLFSKLL